MSASVVIYTTIWSFDSYKRKHLFKHFSSSFRKTLTLSKEYYYWPTLSEKTRGYEQKGNVQILCAFASLTKIQICSKHLNRQLKNAIDLKRNVDKSLMKEEHLHWFNSYTSKMSNFSSNGRVPVFFWHR